MAWGNSANSVCVVEGVDRSQLLHLHKSRYQRLRLHSYVNLSLHLQFASTALLPQGVQVQSAQQTGPVKGSGLPLKRNLSMPLRQKRPPNCMLAVKATAGTWWTLWISSLSLFWRDSNTQCSSCWQETASAAVRSFCHKGCSGPSQRRAHGNPSPETQILPITHLNCLATYCDSAWPFHSCSSNKLSTSQASASWVKLQKQSLHCFHCSGKSSPLCVSLPPMCESLRIGLLRQPITQFDTSKQCFSTSSHGLKSSSADCGSISARSVAWHRNHYAAWFYLGCTHTILCICL